MGRNQRRVLARRVVALGVAASAVLLPGCLTAWLADEEPEPVLRAASGIVFPHGFHIEEQGLVCGDCHTAPGERPSEETCAICHDPVGPAGPAVDECRPCHARDDLAVEAMRSPPAYADVIFDHAPHVRNVDEAGTSCEPCHPGVATSGAGDHSVPSMAGCVECHTERGAPTTCETCHRESTRDRRPPAHGRADWLRVHGREARTGLDRAGDYAASCFYCHTDSSCEMCHDVEPPSDHTEAWRVVAHGLAANVDRTRCLVCHQVETCERCHETEPPRTHVGAWESQHCFTCHQPVGTNQCVVCHEGEHVTAPPRPQNAQHASATESQCRTCHTVIGLPHVDNGDSCVICH